MNISLALILVVFVSFVASQEAAEATETKAALIVIDAQYCSLPGGAAGVKGGDEVILAINDIRTKYDYEFTRVVLTQEWKCSTHISFASVHVGKNPGDSVELFYNAHGQLCESEINQQEYTVPCPAADPASRGKKLVQVLLEDSCVAGQPESDFSKQLIQKPSDVIMKKNIECATGSDSAFRDNTHLNFTTLENDLEAAGINTLLIVGLGGVSLVATASDAKVFSFDAYVISDAVAGLSDADDAALASAGVKIISTEGIPLALGIQEVEEKATAKVSVVVIVVIATLISIATIVAWVVYMTFFVNRKKKSGNFSKVVIAAQDEGEPIVPSDDEGIQEKDDDDSDDSSSDESEEEKSPIEETQATQDILLDTDTEAPEEDS
mmetsp:Transcript_14423/g.15996  ORF Transcript_14423/g.15996 Transcript_14423/m.15996 type:complete len:380 (-) Transcript_14423:112-1251(-)